MSDYDADNLTDKLEKWGNQKVRRNFVARMEHKLASKEHSGR